MLTRGQQITPFNTRYSLTPRGPTDTGTLVGNSYIPLLAPPRPPRSATTLISSCFPPSGAFSSTLTGAQFHECWAAGQHPWTTHAPHAFEVRPESAAASLRYDALSLPPAQTRIVPRHLVPTHATQTHACYNPADDPFLSSRKLQSLQEEGGCRCAHLDESRLGARLRWRLNGDGGRWC